MSLNTIVHMAHDGDLQQRFIACAAQEGIDQPDSWVMMYRWLLVRDTEAVAAYQFAVDGDHDRIGSYGKRSDVINDAKILSIVQARRTAEQAG